MVLTQAQIRGLGIVSDDVPQGWRPTTYDATVGDIIVGGSIIADASYTLAPRGVAWVVSTETFAIPDRVTGMATLRTTWTHQGILALNVGIVDPNWTGSLATALVNLSNSSFKITKGDPFFRVVFQRHLTTGAPPKSVSRPTYVNMITEKSRLFAKTFLDTDSLTAEVAEKVLGFPRWALRLGAFAFIISLLAIFAPIAINVWTDYYQGPAKYERLDKRIDDLDNDKLEARINTLERDLAVLKATKPEVQTVTRMRVVRSPPAPSVVINQ